jgi:hypothetical protein
MKDFYEGIKFGALIIILMLTISADNDRINAKKTQGHAVALISENSMIVTVQDFNKLQRANEALNKVISDMIDARAVVAREIEAKDKLIEAQKMRLLGVMDEH